MNVFFRDSQLAFCSVAKSPLRSRRLGSGNYGCVYRGTLKDGHEVRTFQKPKPHKKRLTKIHDSLWFVGFLCATLKKTVRYYLLRLGDMFRSNFLGPTRQAWLG